MNSFVFFVMLFVCTRVVSSGGDTVESSCMPPEFTGTSISLHPEIPSSESDSRESSSDAPSSEVSSRSQSESSESRSSDPKAGFTDPRKLGNYSDRDNHGNGKYENDSYEHHDRENKNHDTIVNVYVTNQIITSDVKENSSNTNETNNSTNDQQEISENEENVDPKNIGPEMQAVGNDTDASSTVNNAPSGRPKNKRLKSGKDKKKTENGDVDKRNDSEGTENATNSSATTNSTEPATTTDLTMPSSSASDDPSSSQPNDKKREAATKTEQDCSEIYDKSLPVFHSVLSKSTEEQSRCIDLLVGIDLELLTPELLVLNISVDYNQCVDAILDQYSHLLVLLSEILGIPVDDVIELAYDLIDGKTVENGAEACVADEFEQNTSALQKILDNLLNILKSLVLNLKIDLKLLGLDLKVDVMVLKYSKLIELNLDLDVSALGKTVKNLLGEKALENETLRKIKAKGNVHKLLGDDGLL